MRSSARKAMTDADLTRALERGEISPDGFHHASHLHVAWQYLSESLSVSEAAAKMSNTLRALTAAAGKPDKYHDTITLFWIHLLAFFHRRAMVEAKTLEDVVHSNPQLLEKNFVLAYYSRERLFSDVARASWLEPDLRPLSSDAATFCSSDSPGHAPDRSLPR